MGELSSTYTLDLCEEKRKLMNWICKLHEEQSGVRNVHLDVTDLVNIFQSIGFRSETISNLSYVEDIQILAAIPKAIRNDCLCIKLFCPKSGVESILTKETNICKCLKEDEIKDKEFWCGCGSSNQSFASSKSSVFPIISKVKFVVIRVLLEKVLSLINNKDVNENEYLPKLFQNVSSTVPHYTLDTPQGKDNSNIPHQVLVQGSFLGNRIKTSRSTPTSTTTTYVNKTDNIASVLKNLESINKLIDETLHTLAIINETFVKTELRKVSDIKPTGGCFMKTRSILTCNKTVANKIVCKPSFPKKVPTATASTNYKKNEISKSGGMPKITTLRKNALTKTS